MLRKYQISIQFLQSDYLTKHFLFGRASLNFIRIRYYYGTYCTYSSCTSKIYVVVRTIVRSIVQKFIGQQRLVVY